jgi:hypothetical protein
VPSDVIWAAIIAGGVGVLGNGATIWATQLQRASHERTEDKRIEADADRLSAEHDETERQRRLAAYQALTVVLGDLDRAATWAKATNEETEAMIGRFLQLHAEVLLCWHRGGQRGARSGSRNHEHDRRGDGADAGA